MARPKNSQLIHIENARIALQAMIDRDPHRKQPQDALISLMPFIKTLFEKGLTEAIIIDELKLLTKQDDNIGLSGIRAMFKLLKDKELSIKTAEKKQRLTIMNRENQAIQQDFVVSSQQLNLQRDVVFDNELSNRIDKAQMMARQDPSIIVSQPTGNDLIGMQQIIKNNVT